MVKKISIVVPVHNAGDAIKQCLSAIYVQNYPEYDVTVVNDCSEDGLSDRLKDFPCKIMNLSKRSGASVSRNEGAKNADAEVILFLDADVMLQKNCLHRIAEIYEKYPETDVIQGVYTEEAADNNVSTLTRNYYKYHKIEKINRSQINGINSYCFAIKKKVFEKINGFNPQYEGVEDVELGMRLVKNGYKILLDKNLRVKHLKRYTFTRLLRTDYRKVYAKTNLLLNNYFKPKTAIPENSVEITYSLNPKEKMMPEFISIFLSFLIAASVTGAALSKSQYFLYVSIALILLFIFLNFDFLNLIRKRKGLFISVGCFFVYYFEMLIAQMAIFSTLLMFPIKKRY
ncbi:MAG: glycosyltransferase [Elusimicrobiota bacterium]